MTSLLYHPAQVGYASVNLPKYGLRAGMFISGRFNIFGLLADVDFQMNTDGVQLKTNLDFSAVRLTDCHRWGVVPGTTGAGTTPVRLYTVCWDGACPPGLLCFKVQTSKLSVETQWTPPCLHVTAAFGHAAI